ncbi:SWIB-domain-containing protein [Metschnikowia bicuspidata]|uniref:SWIB-domain-containing protein n=1 Tax=Metschnikowia bicuspidata TaxID=27322 RepID=A0A4P9ZIB9_9ASCO|nr:SWIB-domain-containing protein [Metschnikowia bicuspidata]
MIRQALQALYSVNLEPHQKKLNELVRDRYFKMKEKRDEEHRLLAQHMLQQQDRKLALELQRKARRAAAVAEPVTISDCAQTTAASPTTTAKTKTAKTKKKKEDFPGARTRLHDAPKIPFNAPRRLSASLLAIVGCAQMSRPQVVKTLWEYILERGLQEEADRRMIHCDRPHQRVFGRKMVNMFLMNRLLTIHIYGLDEKTGGRAEMQKILEKLRARTAPGARVARDVRILWRLKTGRLSRSGQSRSR